MRVALCDPGAGKPMLTNVQRSRCRRVGAPPVPIGKRKLERGSLDGWKEGRRETYRRHGPEGRPVFFASGPKANIHECLRTSMSKGRRAGYHKAGLGQVSRGGPGVVDLGRRPNADRKEGKRVLAQSLSVEKF